MPEIACRQAVLAAALAVVVPVSLAAAEPKTADQIAHYKGPDRQSVLEAGAKKEGRFIVYTVGGESKPIFERFQQKYPDVRLEILQAPNVDITRRLIEERKAGKVQADAIELNDGPLGLVRDAGALQAYETPEVEAFAPAAIEPKGYWISTYESYKGLGFNTKLVSPDIAPREPEDLLDPKWKGKMALNAQAMPTWVGGLIASRGEDFIRKLGAQDFTVFVMEGSALANLVVSGEVPLSPIVYNSHMHVRAAKGAPVAWRAIGAVYATVNGAAIAKDAPHPYAAQLLVDFLLSKESQTMRINMGYASGRTDLVSPDKPKEILYPSRMPDLEVKFDDWKRLGNQVFGKPKERPGAKEKDEGE
jgi:iron(III) transport system substrate-binding protein